MPTSQPVSVRHGIIAWENAGGDTARLAVPIAIPVRRSMGPTGRGAARLTGQVTPTPLARATLGAGAIEPSAFIGLSRRSLFRGAANRMTCLSHPAPSVPDLDP
jgi:hypothetical protein